MGRGRAPCCAKVGLNKGSWTVEEDMKLISYIQKHGHGNWRALPKLAGLLRCGKSCRLRWVNYLRPDIKRGNFTEEEEDTIIKLHELLGNKWSKIASCLPGRTDNEIKNVWNTHLKKRLASKVQKPAVTGNLEEALISSFSCTCSDQGERKSDEEQIINPSLDCHNSLAEAMLQANNAEDQNISTQHLEQQHAMTPSSFSSTELFQMNHIGTDDIEQEEAKKDDLVIPDILIDPEIWSMIADDDDDGCPFSPVVPNLEGLHQWNSMALEEEPDKDGNCREWLEYLDAWSRSWN